MSNKAFLLIAFLLIGVGCGGSRSPGVISTSETPQLALKLPQAERWELANGLVVLYLHDDELPMMRGALHVLGGGVFDPPELAGLASLTGSQIREGAPRGYDPVKFDALLDKLGASIESELGDDVGSVKFVSLSGDFEQVFGLFAKTVKEPGFEAKRLSLAKKLALESIARRTESPDLMLGLTMKLAMYGEDSPYNKVPTTSSVQRITASDLQRCHQRFFQPQGARLTLTGSVPSAEVRALVEKYFAGWVGGNKEARITIASFPTVSGERPGSVYLLERDLEQATIGLGHLGPARLSPDQFAISIFNRWFGMSGFESILFTEIRSKLGLAYSVYGGFFPAAVSGTFEITAQTRASEALNTVEQIMRLLDESKRTAPESRVIENAKLGVNRSFVFRFQTPSAVVQRRAFIELLGYPNDFDLHYMDNIRGVSAEDVRRLAQERVQPEKIKIAIVGRVQPQEVADRLGRDVVVLSFDQLPQIKGIVKPRTNGAK